MSTHQEYHDMNKSSYAIGNVMFNTSSSLDPPFWRSIKYYFLYYSFGDNTNTSLKYHDNKTGDHTHNHTHHYASVCDMCQYEVTLIAIIVREAFNASLYCKSGHTNISVISESTCILYANIIKN